VAGGRGVHDRQVEDRAARPALELCQVPHLPDRHQLAQPGRGGGEVLEQPAAAEHPRQRARLQLVAQPLLLRLLGIHRDREQAGRQLQLAVPHVTRAEDAGEALLLSHLAHDSALAAPRGSQAQGGCDGRLPDAALARHEHQPLVQ
jgi:hypothetical protein